MSGLALKKRIERLEQTLNVVRAPDVCLDNDGGMRIAVNSKNSQYFPSPTAKKFHNSNSMVRAILGPVGSGKSTMCCVEIMRMAMSDMVMCKDGVRRSKWAIVRNTYPQLKTTTIPTWLMWFSKLGTTRWDSPITFSSVFYDEKGKIEMSVLFYSMDRNEDAGDVDSLEITGAYINEARGLPGEKESIILNTLMDRCARFPQRQSLVNPENLEKKIILDSNPPSTSHWWYNIFEVVRPEKFEIFKQPSGLIKLDNGKYATNPEAENLEHLANNYYVDGTHGKTEEHIKVQLMAQYGSFIIGERVYKSYNDDIHSVDSIDFVPGVEVVIGWDFGTTPHCVFVQQMPIGNVHVIKELYDDNSDVETFAKNIVKPFIDRVLPKDKFDKIISVGDPAGIARGNTFRNCFAVLKDALGHEAIPASTNDISSRIGAVQYFKEKIISGSPAYLLSRTGAKRLREGKNGGYQYKEVSGEKKPLKNMYSHGQDSEQYAFLYIKGEDSKAEKEVKKFKPRKINSGGLY